MVCCVVEAALAFHLQLATACLLVEFAAATGADVESFENELECFVLYSVTYGDVF